MNRLKKHWLDHLSAAVLILAIFILVVLNIFWGENWIDSDMAAEMIFSKLLSEEGRWVAAPNWYYSTEFRVLYTQLIMVFLHHIFSDWHTIRVLTNICFYLTMLGSFYFACRPLRLKKQHVRLCALALFVPVSEAVMTHLQMGNTYMSHVILCFWTMGLFLRLSSTAYAQKKKSRVLYAVLFGVLSVILGISGVRYLLDLLVPMLLTAAVYAAGGLEFFKLRKAPSIKTGVSFLKTGRIRYVWVSCAGMLCGGIGYLINVLYISRIYQFQTYDTTNFIAIYRGEFLERVQNAFGQLLQMFGYIENKAFLSLRGIITILSFVMLFVLGAVWKKCMTYRKERNISAQYAEEGSREFVVLFCGVSLALHLFVFIFTTSTMADRYYIPVAIFFLMTLAIYMEWEKLCFDRVAVCLLLSGCLSLAGVKTYYSFVSHDKNENRYEMSAYLLEQGYTFGYASYWNSNIMTEISNGQLEMANLWSLESLEDFKWSSKMSSYEQKEGKVFLIADRDELYALEQSGMLDKQELIFENEEFLVLHFDSQESFLAYRKQNEEQK